MQETKKKVVFLLSTGYAGSHFLSLLLGSHSRTMHLGELLVMKKPQPETGHRECDFERGDVLAGIAPADVPRIYDIIYSRIDPRVEALIDASKKTSWAGVFLTNERYERKYLHLIRDPRALVRRYGLRSSPAKVRRLRWKIARRFPALAVSIWFAPESDVWLYRWLFQNMEITRFIREHRLDANLLTYRDLARDQAGEIRRLMEWIGLPFEPSQLEYWNKDHIGTQKRNYEWVKEQKNKQHFDLRWKSEMSLETQQRITRNRRVRRYLADINVALIDEGLRREGEAYQSP
jgi:hypothetical protein